MPDQTVEKKIQRWLRLRDNATSTEQAIIYEESIIRLCMELEADKERLDWWDAWVQKWKGGWFSIRVVPPWRIEQASMDDGAPNLREAIDVARALDA